MVSLGMSFAQQSFEAAAAEALLMYRASLRASEDVEAKLHRVHYGQRAAPIQMNLTNCGPHIFAHLSLLRASRSVLAALIDNSATFRRIGEAGQPGVRSRWLQ